MFPLSWFWLLISYLLGSFPTGYLIAKASGKDILKIGWRKTSGSNVFKNVGKSQGVLTGILDVLKGYLSVFGAQKLELSQEIQILSGITAVTGHNWSIFLNFAGGRGIGTLIGALFAFSPKILGFSLIPFALLALIWNASIGTLIFLLGAILLSAYFNQFQTAGFFLTISLFPILIKRLSPIGEIFLAKNKLILARNRLVFDNDEALFELRIKRLIRRINREKDGNNPGKESALQKAKKIILSHRFFSTIPHFPPSKSTEYGVQTIKERTEKLILRISEKKVEEIGIPELKKMMIASSKKIVFYQEEINKINVFPVVDRDTGYNLAATLLGVEKTISQKEYQSLQELSKDIREAVLANARGNAGMIYTGYLIRILDEIKDCETINSLKLASAMRKGTRAAYLSILNPVEGTILDPMKSAGRIAYELAKNRKEKNIIKILEEAKIVSEKALQETKEKLQVLKQNNVVDAGAFGFTKILEAWLESLRGENGSYEKEVSLPYLEIRPGEKTEYRYDLIFRIKSTPKLKELRKELFLLGGSIDIIETEKEVKIHIHTNFPEKIREKIQDLKILEWRLEDINEQVKTLKKTFEIG